MIIDTTIKEFKQVFSEKELNAIIKTGVRKNISLTDILGVYDDYLYHGDSIEYDRGTYILDIMISIKDAVVEANGLQFCWYESASDYVVGKIKRILNGEFTIMRKNIRIDKRLYDKLICVCGVNKLNIDVFVDTYNDFLNIHSIPFINETNKAKHDEALVEILRSHGVEDMKSIELRLNNINNTLLLEM